MNKVSAPSLHARLSALSLRPGDASAPGPGPHQSSAALPRHRPPQVPSPAAPELQAGDPLPRPPPVLAAAAPPGEDSLQPLPGQLQSVPGGPSGQQDKYRAIKSDSFQSFNIFFNFLL